jgi:putative sporulation protein YtaF
MIFLSSFLLSIALNLETLRISLTSGIKKIYLTKSTAISLAIITSIGTFISMYLGKIILHLFKPELANIFGGILLSFIGVYFIIEYIRLEEKHAGHDTSYFFESSFKYINILETSDIANSDNSISINMKKCLSLSQAFILNNLFTCFAASITGISIGISVIFNFIITIFCIYLGNFNSNIYISKWFSKYSNLTSGVILIVLGLFETFI